ncbi:MAG: TolC family protein [Candidatus Latescibacterota bacterium]|jgi:cobalt-zinc-cadmium efflux system outer membrane protein
MKAHILQWTLCWVVLLTTFGIPKAQGEQGVSRRPLGAGLPAYDAPGILNTAHEPADTLALRDALGLALLHNPRLAAFSWEVRAGEAAQLQAGAWPNPEIALEYENFAVSGALEGVDFAEATLALSQLVLLGGKRDKRTQVARMDKTMAGWNYEAARITTYTATVKAFVNVLAAQQQLSLAGRIVEIAEDIEEAVSARVRAGGTLALEENRARVAVESSLIEELLARRHLAITRRELAAMWGSRTPQFSHAAGALERVNERTPALDSLLVRVDQNPAVARWTTELARRRARVDLVKADRVPDLNLVAGLRHLNEIDDLGFVIGVAAPLPTWDRKEGAIREAEYLSDQVTPARRADKTEIQRDIAVAYEILAGAYDEITRIRDRVLPEAEAAAVRSGNAYRAGAIQLTDVLDIQRTFFHLRIRYVKALARYHGAVAEIEGLIGEPLNGSSGAPGGKERE